MTLTFLLVDFCTIIMECVSSMRELCFCLGVKRHLNWDWKNKAGLCSFIIYISSVQHIVIVKGRILGIAILALNERNGLSSDAFDEVLNMS